MSRLQLISNNPQWMRIFWRAAFISNLTVTSYIEIHGMSLFNREGTKKLFSIWNLTTCVHLYTCTLQCSPLDKIYSDSKIRREQHWEREYLFWGQIGCEIEVKSLKHNLCNWKPSTSSASMINSNKTSLLLSLPDTFFVFVIKPCF